MALHLRTGAAHLSIDPDIGGALTGFTWRERPVLRPTTPAAIASANVRLTSCYPLVPYSNRIRDARLAVDGVRHVLERNFGEHAHAIHGIGWQRAWSVEEALPHRARLALRHDTGGVGAAAWPWPFRATQAFELATRANDDDDDGDAAILTVTLTLENAGASPFPFGLGWHPFFPKGATTTLGFGAEAVWENDPTQLPLRRAAVPPQWRFDPERAMGALSLDNVFTGWDGVASLRDHASGMQTTVAADRACRYLVVYTPPDADFIALEPVTHETDAFNRAAEGAVNAGTRMLAPGAAFSCTMRIIAAAID